ncbi:MAG TPA: hypothetical protein VGM56_15290 [Byssovorax sp.]|jgi:hypothetical protein
MSDESLVVSKALLGAALTGLLCIAACTTSGATGDDPLPDTACPSGVSPDPAVTSSATQSLTQQQFQTMCSARGGVFEIQPHCGGSNACRGFSYDSDTQTLTEHTCRATNQCSGYSCVICSEPG